MKNEYKETSPEMLAMRESVTYYMQLTDYIMQEPALLNRHDKLCRLIITIAEDYPDSIAANCPLIVPQAVECCFEVVVVEPEVGVLEPERVVLRLQLLRVGFQRVVVGLRDADVVAGEEEER